MDHGVQLFREISYRPMSSRSCLLIQNSQCNLSFHQRAEGKASCIREDQGQSFQNGNPQLYENLYNLNRPGKGSLWGGPCRPCHIMRRFSQWRKIRNPMSEERDHLIWSNLSASDSSISPLFTWGSNLCPKITETEYCSSIKS